MLRYINISTKITSWLFEFSSVDHLSSSNPFCPTISSVAYPLIYSAGMVKKEMARAFFFVIVLPRACTFWLENKGTFSLHWCGDFTSTPPIHKGDCLLKASIKLHMVGCGGGGSCVISMPRLLKATLFLLFHLIVPLSLLAAGP